MDEDGISLGFFLILVPAFLLGKALVALGLLTLANATKASWGAAAVVALLYAAAIEPVRTFGLPIIVAKMIIGSFVGMTTWFLIWLGFLWALPEAEENHVDLGRRGK